MKRRSVKRLVAVILAERRSGRDRRQRKREQDDRRIDVTDSMAKVMAIRKGGGKP